MIQGIEKLDSRNKRESLGETERLHNCRINVEILRRTQHIAAAIPEGPRRGIFKCSRIEISVDVGIRYGD